MHAKNLAPDLDHNDLPIDVSWVYCERAKQSDIGF